MKKNTFLQGAFIATFAVLISKVLGVIYVIPFYSIIGEQGGALYGYAYSIYSIFLGLSTSGFPLAISKTISEYNALSMYNTKERAYKLGNIAIFLLGFVCFVILFIFAPSVAHIIIGDIQGGNSLEDVTFVVRVISTAMLVVPTLSVLRGYLQGHRYISISAVSQVIEQIVRVIIIVAGSYIGLKVLNLSLKTTVGIAIFAATVSALSAVCYLYRKVYTNKKELNRYVLQSKEEKHLTNKDILKKLLMYSIPFIIIELIRSFYAIIDASTINATFVKTLGYTIKESESVLSIFTTWGLKLNTIILSVSTGLMISLIPTITTSFVKKNYEDVKNKINRTLQVLLFVVLPMTVGMSLLAKPLWVVFFGSGELGPLVFKYSIYTALAATFINTMATIMQGINAYKAIIISTLIGFIIKVTCNVPLMIAFDKLGLHAAYGVTTASILAYVVSFVLCLIYFKNKLNIDYSSTVKRLGQVLVMTGIMVIVILVLKLFIPMTTTNRIYALLIALFYSVVGVVVYLFVSFKNKSIYHIVGVDMINKVKRKLHLLK